MHTLIFFSRANARRKLGKPGNGQWHAMYPGTSLVHTMLPYVCGTYVFRIHRIHVHYFCFKARFQWKLRGSEKEEKKEVETKWVTASLLSLMQHIGFDHYFRFCPSLLSFGSTILLKILVYSYIVKHIHITVIYILHIYTNMYAQLARLDINFVVAASVRK